MVPIYCKMVSIQARISRTPNTNIVDSCKLTDIKAFMFFTERNAKNSRWTVNTSPDVDSKLVCVRASAYFLSVVALSYGTL